MAARDLIERVRKALGDRYTVLSAVGRGGNASIFAAKDASGAHVAIKVLHPELAVSVAADRFLREIRYASQLNHPHIARMMDSGEADYLLWYVMPYLPGTRSARRCSARPASRSPARSRSPRTSSRHWSTPTRTGLPTVTSSRTTLCSHPAAGRDPLRLGYRARDRELGRRPRDPERLRRRHRGIHESGAGAGRARCRRPHGPLFPRRGHVRIHRGSATVLLAQCSGGARHASAPRAARPARPAARRAKELAAVVARALAKSRAERWQRAAEMRAALLPFSAGAA